MRPIFKFHFSLDIHELSSKKFVSLRRKISSDVIKNDSNMHL